MAAIFDALPPDFSAAVQVHAPRKRRFALRAQHTMIWCNECVFWERGALALANIHAHTLTLPLPLSLFLPFSLSPFRSHPFYLIYLGEYTVRSCRLIGDARGQVASRQVTPPPPLSFSLSMFRYIVRSVPTIQRVYCALNAHNITSILCAQCPWGCTWTGRFQTGLRHPRRRSSCFCRRRSSVSSCLWRRRRRRQRRG